MDITSAIDKRYTNLAEKSCCLSCGGAINNAEISSGEICLDIGSGRGNDVLRMADLVGKDGFAYGVDMSEGMLNKARKSADKLGIKNVEFLNSNIEEIPLDENSVNVIISNCTINHAQNKKAVWEEIFRVLKPGGRFIVSDIYSTEVVPEKYSSDPVAVSECWGGSVTKDSYLDTLIEAGFKELQLLEESDPYAKGAIEVASFTIKGFK